MKYLLSFTLAGMVCLLGACGFGEQKTEVPVAAESAAPVPDTANAVSVEAPVPALDKAGQPLASLYFLRSYKGEYPQDIQLLAKSPLKERLIALVGKEKQTWMLANLNVSTPVEIEHNWMYTWGMKANEGGDPGMVIMADLSRNVLYVGIKNKGDNGFYSDDNSTMPPRMAKWMNEKRK
jgi:hypothetical protein